MTRVAAALAIVLAAQAAATGSARAEGDTPKRPAIESPDGVPVTFASKDVATEIFLAHGDVPVGAVPDPFERVGIVPVTVKLAPGTYTIETASATQSTGHQRFYVEQGSPMSIVVKPGDASVKTFGGVFSALGVVGVVLGIVAIVSISPHDEHYDRWTVGLTVGGIGAGLVAIGVGMSAAGSTGFDTPHLPPGSAPKGATGSIVWRF